MERGREPHPNDEGFTLVELLVVIIVLGVLATITVFAVRGITDKGEENAQGADEHTLVTAEEAHLALHDAYASESGLVSAGLLTEPSEHHDIDLLAGGDDYQIVPEGAGTTVPSTTPVTTPVTTPATTPETTATTVPSGPATTLVPPPHPLHSVSVAGFSGQAYGSGPNRIVIISDGTSFLANWNQIVSEGVVLPTTEVVWIGGGVATGAAVNAILATNPRYVVAASSVAMTTPDMFVGQYLSTRLSDDQFWWGHQDGGLMLMIEHYRTEIVDGG